MKKYWIGLCLFLGLNQAVLAQNTDTYRFLVDLQNVTNDQVSIVLNVPTVGTSENVVYCMPKVVPGTYSVSDFGRFVKNLEAKDKNGKNLEVKQLDVNRWQISSAGQLAQISYKVDDTFDSELENPVFEPGGTNIDDKSNFVINNFGFFGYFEGMERKKFEITVKKPEKMFGASSLSIQNIDPQTDRYQADNYMSLADAPVMYNFPDTTVIKVGGAQILISVYSPNKMLDSKYVAENVKGVLEAQKEYLGGKLPIQKYAFIIHLFTGSSNSGAYGALEHSYSSLYFLPEMQPAFLAQTIKDVAAHEFFHIVTPLSIHAEQIHNFDFINPKMSKHLWLYEGVVEYFAHHVQVRSKLTELDDYLKKAIREKIVAAEKYDQNLSFTDLSSNCLDKTADQYGNVYEKGALIAMCLDIELLSLSNGKYSLRQLLADLSKEYGTEKAFKDEELFDKIIEISKMPSLKNFFEDYVAGTKALPIAQQLEKVGVKYAPKFSEKRYSLGNVFLMLQADKLTVVDNSQMDEVGEQLGYQIDDQIVQINKEKITPQNAEKIISGIRKNSKVGSKLVVYVKRQVKGKLIKKKLKAKLMEQEYSEEHYLSLKDNASAAEIALRKAWLNQ